MADSTYPRGTSTLLLPAATVWGRVSPSLVPIFAVLTALLLTIPFMVLTGAEGSLARGLNIAGTAYAALLEGSLGLAINPVASPDDVDLVLQLAENQDLTRRDLLLLADRTERLATTGTENVREFSEVIDSIVGTEAVPDDEALIALGERIQDMILIGPDRLRDYGPLIVALSEADRGEVRALAERVAELDALDDETRAEIVAFVPAAEAYDSTTLLDALRLVNTEGIVSLARVLEQLTVLDALGLEATSPEARDIAAIYALGTDTTNGVGWVRQFEEVRARLAQAGVSNIERAGDQLRLTLQMYDAGLLTNEDTAAAIREELPGNLEEGLAVKRPNNRLLLHPGHYETVGTIYADDGRVQTIYANLGSRVLLFFPDSLEETLRRAIPYIIAGLAVTLGFKAGLFNIGAEGQLYIGAIFGVFVGYSVSGLPALVHIPLMLIAGVIGGGLWGMIPGALKAFTGAHEVISTIMLNFIAIRLVDWLIKSDDPVIMLDTAASTPRTPYILESARLPGFQSVSPVLFIIAGIVVLGFMLYTRREVIRQDWRNAIRPLVYGLLVIVGGFFIQWTSVRNNLHVGLVLMLLTVWLVDWFLERTTIGFELRTVGANPNAARYAGMSVRGNTILALTLSGALVGLAGTIQISGVQQYMEPTFFAGLGFDSIAVALLARNNPRNMIAAGILWGALLTGAGLMQERASLSNDLVRIIQALIIMFIAADAIIRNLWRVPKARAGEKAVTFSKGWGG
ncbi:MAG: ABC transporter permease [bacterium]|nr:ABC transporter permease [bacterium]